jgi:hypothetical protein
MQTLSWIGLGFAREFDFVTLMDAPAVRVNDPDRHLWRELDIKAKSCAAVVPVCRVLRLTRQILVVVLLLGDEAQNGLGSDPFAVGQWLRHCLDARGDYVALSVQPGDLIGKERTRVSQLVSSKGWKVEVLYMFVLLQTRGSIVKLRLLC